MALKSEHLQQQKQQPLEQLPPSEQSQQTNEGHNKFRSFTISLIKWKMVIKKRNIN